MPQPPKVKKALESVQGAKVAGATTSEARGTAASWASIANDVETTNDLRSLAVFWRDALTGAVVRGDSAAQEAALGALDATAARFL